MGWGGDMFPGTVWAYTDLHNKYTQTNPLERQRHRSKYMYAYRKTKRRAQKKTN